MENNTQQKNRGKCVGCEGRAGIGIFFVPDSIGD